MSAATSGAILASRRSHHPVGWLLLAFGLVVQALTSAAEGYARYGLLARPGMLPAATCLALSRTLPSDRPRRSGRMRRPGGAVLWR